MRNTIKPVEVQFHFPALQSWASLISKLPLDGLFSTRGLLQAVDDVVQVCRFLFPQGAVSRVPGARRLREAEQALKRVGFLRACGRRRARTWHTGDFL